MRCLLRDNACVSAFGVRMTLPTLAACQRQEASSALPGPHRNPSARTYFVKAHPTPEVRFRHVASSMVVLLSPRGKHRFWCARFVWPRLPDSALSARFTRKQRPASRPRRARPRRNRALTATLVPGLALNTQWVPLDWPPRFNLVPPIGRGSSRLRRSRPMRPPK